MSLQSLRDHLEKLRSDPFARDSEINAAVRVIAECENQMKSLGLPEDCGDIPPILETAIRSAYIGNQLQAGDVMQRYDFDQIVIQARDLGIDAIRVSQLWSQMHAVTQDGANTRLGLFALRALVENCYLHRQIAELNKTVNGTISVLNLMHKAEAPKKNAKK